MGFGYKFQGVLKYQIEILRTSEYRKFNSSPCSQACKHLGSALGAQVSVNYFYIVFDKKMKSFAEIESERKYQIAKDSTFLNYFQ